MDTAFDIGDQEPPPIDIGPMEDTHPAMDDGESHDTRRADPDHDGTIQQDEAIPPTASDNVQLPQPSVSPPAIPPVPPIELPAAIEPYSLVDVMEESGFDEVYLEHHQRYHTPIQSPSPSRPSSRRGTLQGGEAMPVDVALNQTSTEEASISSPRNKAFAPSSQTEVQATPRDVSSPMSSGHSESSGVVATLGTVLDEMALNSSNNSASSGSPVPTGVGIQKTQVEAMDSFEDWSSKDGSGTNTFVERSPSSSLGEQESQTTSAASSAPIAQTQPLTPKPTLTAKDLDFHIISSQRS